MQFQPHATLRGIKINIIKIYAPNTGYEIDERIDYWNNIKYIRWGPRKINNVTYGQLAIMQKFLRHHPMTQPIAFARRNTRSTLKKEMAQNL